MKKSVWAVLALVLVLACSSALAADRAQIDPLHSSVSFRIRHIVGNVIGRFDAFHGTVSLDPMHLDKSFFNLVVETASVDTDVSDRDRHLRSEDFLDATRYPEIRFSSTSVKKVDKGEFMVDGKLTIKGTTLNVEIPVYFLGSKEHPTEKCVRVTGLEAVFSLDRLRYGVGSGKFADMGLVGKEVDVFVAMELKDSMPGCRP